MIISLEITPELENKLRQTAANKGTTLESYLTDLIQRDLISREEIGISLPKDELRIKKRRSKGSAKGLITISPDFDRSREEFQVNRIW
ncbi:MAG: hypothetical protein AAGA60_26765 [Cyanobacteria bacterium P01_E01_bin.42]